MPFNNPVVGGTTLVRSSIHSPNFVHNNLGWSINQDGTAEFSNALIRGTIVVGNGTTNTIIIDNVRDAIFVYDVSGVLIASIAPSSGTDSFGNAYQAGFASYTNTDRKDYIQMVNSSIFFNLDDTGSNYGYISANSALLTSLSPWFTFRSPANNAADTASVVNMYGASNDNSQQPYMEIKQVNTAALMPVYLGGYLYHMDSNGNRETYHAASLTAAWSNIGAPFDVVKYRISGDGNFVELSGLAIFSGSATAPSPVFTLPVGYRTNFQRNFAASTSPSPTVNPTTCTIQVLTSGVVQVSNYAGTNPGVVSFEGVHIPLST